MVATLMSTVGTVSCRGAKALRLKGLEGKGNRRPRCGTARAVIVRSPRDFHRMQAWDLTRLGLCICLDCAHLAATVPPYAVRRQLRAATLAAGRGR